MQNEKRHIASETVINDSVSSRAIILPARVKQTAEVTDGTGVRRHRRVGLSSDFRISHRRGKCRLVS
jgi:hypothetical protein